ncbi:MAG: CoA pyrophosphatase [Kangiellaceae bacterium]|nr:CoA pyrophosphatase [Kangiellaceae bacterium]
MDIETIKSRLLSVNYIDPKDDSEQQDAIRLKAFMEASGKPVATEFKQAGVLIPLVYNQSNKGWDVILTRRALHLKHHAGEISFPGGRFEKKDLNLKTTAIRETVEEIGLKEDQIEVIGRLPQQSTISQYRVTPYIGIVSNDYQLRIDENEVVEAFSIPLQFAINPDNHQIVNHQLSGQTFSYFVIQYNNYRVWGATAQMIIRLSERLNE